VGASFGMCGVNCVGIIPVLRVEVVPCDLDSVHRGDSSGRIRLISGWTVRRISRRDRETHSAAQRV
jgi:hypothetical protein